MKKTLRFIGILFMGITAAVTLLGGVGTTCVALNPTAYESMKAIAQYQWLYILYVLIGVALGIQAYARPFSWPGRKPVLRKLPSMF